MKIQWISLFVLFSLAVTGCLANQAGRENEDIAHGEPKITPSVEPQQSPLENPLQNPTQQNYPDASAMPVNKFVDLAKLDLAKLLSIETDQIKLVNTLEIIWPDSSLGCPSPGKVYAQGKVPGYRIWLIVGDVKYIYHAGTNGQIIYCPDIDSDNNSPLLPNPAGPTPQIGVPIN